MSLTIVGLLAGIVFTAGCATVGAPYEQIASAELAIRRADEANAQQYAPLELRIAREKLDGARQALDDENAEEARRLSEQSLVDAQLAETKAQTAQALATTAGLRESIEALRDESVRASERLEIR
jgi:hypothetical protein